MFEDKRRKVFVEERIKCETDLRLAGGNESEDQGLLPLRRSWLRCLPLHYESNGSIKDLKYLKM